MELRPYQPSGFIIQRQSRGTTNSYSDSTRHFELNRPYANAKFSQKKMLGVLSISIIVTTLLYCESLKRNLWIYGPNDCNNVVGKEDPLYGTLFASYPGSGVRLQRKGGQKKNGIIKTHYPHFEGIWSYDNYMEQTILVIRNPLSALPSYHNLLAEVGYARTYQFAYQEEKPFTSPVEDWIKWRDYRFDDEMDLWGKYIDFWMENGTQYWMDMDFERNGQWPFRFLNETVKPWPQALPCKYYTHCVPKAVVSYERLMDHDTEELHKISTALRHHKQEGMNNNADALGCSIYHETVASPQQDGRKGFPETAYNFTIAQMETMHSTLTTYRIKYGSDSWTNHPQAQDLVTKLKVYIMEVQRLLEEAYLNPPPTPSPNPQYLYNITQWYSSLGGRGNQYSKEKVQAMGIWDLVKHHYADVQES